MTAQTSIIQELDEAMTQGSAERRAETLRRVSDLFVSGAMHYTDQQIALFDDVIGRLAAEIETAARIALATRLAPVANAPPALMRTLAIDPEIAVARPVLMQSSRLDDSALVEISQVADQPHLLAISLRKELSDTVTDVLLERGDQNTLRSVVANAGARFSQPGYSTLVSRSEADDEMATLVGMRPDLPRHLFLQLLAKASDDVRTNLQRSNIQSAWDIRRVVDSVAARIAAKTAAVSREYHTARTCIETLHSSGQLSKTHLDDFAKAGKFEEAVVALASLCNVPIETVERAMMQQRPETVLILARAAGLTWQTTRSLLLLRGQSRGMSAHDLDECLTNFYHLKQSTAQQVIRLPRFGHK
jgi:uncharacterized protein (DUF2336 family)